MADNIAAKSDATTTLGTLAADDIGGVLFVRNKLVHGADGVNAGDVSTANPLPTVDSTGNTSLASIDGKITAVNTGAVVVSSSALPSGAATAAKQPALGTAGSASTDVITVQGIASGVALPASQSGTWTVQPGNTANTTAWKVDASSVAVPITDNSGSLTVDAPVGTPAFVRLSDGAAAITTLPVSLASVPSHAVTNAGTFAVQSASAGDVAHDGVDSGNPTKVGFKAITSQSGLTLVAASDRTDGFAGVDGIQLTRPHTNLESIVSGNASNTDGTSTQVLAAQASGIKAYLTTVILTNTSSSNIYVEMKDGTTVKLTIPVPANGGAVVNLPVPIGGTAATAWNFDPSAAATTVYCSVVGFISKV